MTVASGKDRSIPSTLILGYGNIDRQDDGVAWHVLAGLWVRLSRGNPPDPDQGFHPDPIQPMPHFLFDLQLSPEMAEIIAAYERVLFVDAHTGQVPQEINIVKVESDYQSSPFTHHMTPSTCLSLCETIYGKRPQAVLVSVRGYEFRFTRSLSDQTASLVKSAIGNILDWLNGDTGTLNP